MNIVDVLFTDVETAAQYKTFDEVPDNFKKLWSRQVRQSYRDLLPDGTDTENIPQDVLATMYIKKAALHAEFAKIVCLSVGKFVDNGDGKDPTLKVRSFTGEEVTLLKIFGQAADKAKALCAHNGKKFDFPFLARRSVINSLPIHILLDVRGAKPWEVTNIDTQECWRFGDMVYPSLALLCAVLGLEGKDDLDGSEIHNAYYSGNIAKVGSHCSQDVVALAKVYVKLVLNKTVDNVVVL